MQFFKLCYRLDDEHLIIPARLPMENKTALESFEQKDALAYELSFSGFLPRHIMPGLIVTRHTEIVVGPEGQRVWQNGVQLRAKHLDAHALMTASYHQRTLSLWIRGTDAARYFDLLHADVLQLQENMAHLEMVPHLVLDDSCRVNERRFGDTTVSKIPIRLLQAYEKRRFTPFPDGHGNEYDLDQVLRKYLPEDPQRNSGVYVHVGGDVTAPLGIAGHAIQDTRIGDNS